MQEQSLVSSINTIVNFIIKITSTLLFYNHLMYSSTSIQKIEQKLKQKNAQHSTIEDKRYGNNQYQTYE